MIIRLIKKVQHSFLEIAALNFFNKFRLLYCTIDPSGDQPKPRQMIYSVSHPS